MTESLAMGRNTLQIDLPKSCFSEEEYKKGRHITFFWTSRYKWF
jgi:hypothetical protein